MKKDFIILIGSDGSGKSTLARGLSDTLGYPVEHHGPVKNHEEGYNEYFNCIRDTDYSVIKDRFHEGEAIFAPLYRGYEANYFPELEQELKYKFNPLLVLVHAPYDKVVDRIFERGEDFVKPQHLKRCYDKVVDIFNESSLPKIMVDTYHNSPEKNIKTIVKRILQ